MNYPNQKTSRIRVYEVGQWSDVVQAANLDLLSKRQVGEIPRRNIGVEVHYKSKGPITPRVPNPEYPSRKCDLLDLPMVKRRRMSA